MFAALGRATYRFRVLVLGLGVVALAVGGAWGTGVFGALVGGGFEDPGSESVRAEEVLADAFGRRSGDVVVLWTAADGDVRDALPRLEDAVASLPAEHVAATVLPSDNPAAVSGDGARAYAVLQLAGSDEAAREESLHAVEPLLRSAPSGVETSLGGPLPTFEAVGSQIESDIARAELLSFPVLAVLLVVVFGGLVAASLPLAVGGVAILGAFTSLRLLTEVTDVSVFAINVVTLLGLGLAIDYALFVVTRFREELRRTDDVAAALERTMATAGRTVAFSGATVALSLLGLLIFPQVFLRSMGLGGAAAALVAVVAALTLLPAALGVLGHRVDALQVPALRRRRERREADPDGGLWARVAAAVMRRPVGVLAVVVPLLLVLALPFLGVRWGNADASSLPADSEPRLVAESLAADFPADPTAGLVVALPGVDASGAQQVAAAVARLDGVVVATPTGTSDGVSRVDVVQSAPPSSEEARELVQQVRDVPVPAGGEVLVDGTAAEFDDLLASLGDRLPVFLAVVVVTTLVVLFLAFGSVVLPLKAVLMNVLSVGAAFGVVTWIFQEGHLAGLFGVTTTGSVEATQPVLMLAILFGLSMDYEVFLLSRVKEAHDSGLATERSVAVGLQRTGRIITAAALLLVVVIGAFSTSGVVFIKMIGVGMAVAILLDATVIRGLVVPALMRLMGDVNWWAPAPLARLHRRIGFSEVEPPAPAPVQRGPDGAGRSDGAGAPGSDPAAAPAALTPQ